MAPGLRDESSLLRQGLQTKAHGRHVIDKASKPGADISKHFGQPRPIKVACIGAGCSGIVSATIFWRLLHAEVDLNNSDLNYCLYQFLSIAQEKYLGMFIPKRFFNRNNRVNIFIVNNCRKL